MTHGVRGRILKSHNKDGIEVIDDFQLDSVSAVGEEAGVKGMDCEKCGGKMKRRQTPCPSGKSGCLVAHYGRVCVECGYWPGGKSLPKPPPPIWSD